MTRRRFSNRRHPLFCSFCGSLMVIKPDDIQIHPITAKVQCRGVVLCAVTTGRGENLWIFRQPCSPHFSKEPWSRAATMSQSPLHTADAMGIGVWGLACEGPGMSQDQGLEFSGWEGEIFAPVKGNHCPRRRSTMSPARWCLTSRCLFWTFSKCCSSSV